MRKPLSKMTAHEIVECQAALGLTARAFAQALGKATPTLSSYKSGRFAIPMEVANRTNELIQHEKQQIEKLASNINATITLGQLISFQNTRKKSLVHNTEARFMRRQLPVSTKTLPPYRMTKRQFTAYVAALASWHAHIKQLLRLYNDEARQRDYTLELADIKALATSAPRAMPYDVVIQANEWDVVSRALRHHGKAAPYAYSFYQTWRKNRGAGSYLNFRQRAIEARLAAQIKSS